MKFNLEYIWQYNKQTYGTDPINHIYQYKLNQYFLCCPNCGPYGEEKYGICLFTLGSLGCKAHLTRTNIPYVGFTWRLPESHGHYQMISIWIEVLNFIVILGLGSFTITCSNKWSAKFHCNSWIRIIYNYLLEFLNSSK
jgi:hypothetical protein